MFLWSCWNLILLLRAFVGVDCIAALPVTGYSGSLAYMTVGHRGAVWLCHFGVAGVGTGR